MYCQLVCYCLVVAALIAHCIVAAESSCEIPISSKQHYRYQWPLVFQSDGALYTTTAADEVTVQVADGAQVLLSCGPNYFKQHHRQEVLTVRCDGQSGNFSRVTETATPADSEQTKSIKDYACDLRVIEEVLNPVDGCVDEQWTASRFGYVHPTAKLTYLLGEVCYDTHEGRTHFAHIKLGAEPYLQKLNPNYLTTHQHPDGRYKIDLFRGLHFDELYEHIRTKLHRRQAPHLKLVNFVDDALLGNAQYQAVKKLSWNYVVVLDELQVLDVLKADIKRLSESLPLDVYVGGHGVKTLHGANGEQMQLYLQPAVQRFPAPDLLWLVVRHQQRAIAFAVPNEAANVITAPTSAKTPTCHSVCSQITWLSKSLRELTAASNAISCCAYEEIKSAFMEVPPLRGDANKFELLL